MISHKDEAKIGRQCGLEVRESESGNVYIGSVEQIREFNRLCGVLEEQFENEADIIRENTQK